MVTTKPTRSRGTLPSRVNLPNSLFKLSPEQTPSLTAIVLANNTFSCTPRIFSAPSTTGGFIASRQRCLCSWPAQCCQSFALLRPSTYLAHAGHHTGNFLPHVPFSPGTRSWYLQGQETRRLTCHVLGSFRLKNRTSIEQQYFH